MRRSGLGFGAARVVLAATLAVTTSAVAMLTGARAQEFPDKPVKILVGLAPGGITDVTARIYADAVTRTSGWKFVIENRAGAGGGTAAIAVQNSDPDGYTLLVFSGSQHATVAATSQASYEPVKGFTPITLLFNSVVLLTVPANHPAKTLVALHEIGRGKPEGLTFGTPGVGSPSHLLGAKVAMAAKVKVHYVHFRGGSPALVDIIAGRIDFGWPTVSTARGFLIDGQLRALAIDADTRLAQLPDVPTLNELGFGKEKVAPWFALGGPAGIPAPIVAKIRAAFVKASQDAELKRRLDENGTPIVTSTPEEMGRAMAKEWDEMQELVKVLGLKPQ